MKKLSIAEEFKLKPIRKAIQSGRMLKGNKRKGKNVKNRPTKKY
jgi:hypothetical protein